MAEHNIVLLTAPWTLARTQAKLNMGKTPDWDRMCDNLSPHLWDRFSGDGSTLDRLCSACPDSTTFMCTLFFAHLLDQSRTPPPVVQWLEHKQADISRIMTCSPRQLQKGCWRTIAVPLAHMHKGYMVWMLVGTGPDLDLFPLGSQIFDNQAIKALHTARDLVGSQWNTSLAVCPLAREIHAQIIAGPSLGLPVYLGAAAAHNHLECSNILATGRLDPDGSIQKVGHLREKAGAAGPEIRVFIHPAGDRPLGSPHGRKDFECIPVSTINEAYAVMRCHTPGLGMKVASAQYILDHDQDIIQELCGLVPGMEAWVRLNGPGITQKLQNAKNLQALVQQVKQWAHATTGTCHDLAHAVLDCFTPSMVQTMERHDPQMAWDIAMLQIKRANHCGRTDLFSQWNSIATRLQPHIECLRQGDEEALLHGVLELINESHNRYDFDPELPQRMEKDSLIKDLKEAFDRKCRRCNGPCEAPVLGQYFGTLGQHFLFCGSDHHDRGMAYLEKAMQAFGSGQIAGDCRREWERDMLYAAFGLLEAGRFEEAEQHLATACHKADASLWPVENMNPFQIHCLLRLHVDAARPMEDRLWSMIGKQIPHIQGHPSQLITLNLALLARDREERHKLLTLSLEQCMASGPTIQAMALLPLAHMFQKGMDSVDLDRYCQRLHDIIDRGPLHRPHFAPLLHAPSSETMLTRVLREPHRFFPYMYR